MAIPPVVFTSEGWEEMGKTLEEMIRGLEPDVIAQWVDMVEQTAKKLCNDPDCKRIKFEFVNNTFVFHTADIKALDCVIQALKQHLASMPSTTRNILSQILKKLEDDKANIQST